MPDVADYESEDEWMAACVPKRIDEGDSQPEAVAVCMNMWGEKKSAQSVVLELMDRYEDATKMGSRHNLSDRQRIRTIRSLTLELEPNDVDVAPEEPGEVVLIPDPEKSIDTLVAYGNEVKALGNGLIGGYLVRFSDENSPDLTGDFFTRETDYGDADGAPVYYDHGMDETLKRRRFGRASHKMDDTGIWAETQLQLRDEYEQYIYQWAEAGKLGWSSGTAGHLVEREEVDKAWHITSWPLGLDDSLTLLPAEPRNTVIPLKSMSASLPSIPTNLKAAAEAVGDTARSEGEAEETIPPNLKTVEGIHMEITEEKLAELVGSAVSQGVEQALKSLPAVTPDIGVKVTKDEADQEWAHPGEFFKAVKLAAYYPKEEDPRLRSVKATGMSEGVPSDGGYLLPQETAAGIVDHMLEEGSILSRISLDNVAGNSMTYNGIDESTHVGSLYGGLVGYWLGEGGTKTSSKPKFYQVELKLKKIAALCYATDEQLEDTPNLQSWLMRTVPSVLRWYVESAIISGDGNGKPLGITASPCLVSQVREDANEVNPSDFATMWSRRWLGASDYVWLVNPTVAAQMNQFAVGTLPVYMPGNNITGKPYATVYGQPVIESEHVATWKSAGDILLCALSQYQAIGKGGVQAATSIHVAFTTDETAFRFVYRIDGQPLWNSAVTPENGSTFSPFVSLAAASS